MIRAAALALVAAVAAVPAAAEPGDVDYYRDNHAERRAKLEWCRRDAVRFDGLRECRNAYSADVAGPRKPEHPWSRGRTVFPDSNAPWFAPVPVQPPPERAPREPRRRAT